MTAKKSLFALIKSAKNESSAPMDDEVFLLAEKQRSFTNITAGGFKWKSTHYNSNEHKSAKNNPGPKPSHMDQRYAMWKKMKDEHGPEVANRFLGNATNLDTVSGKHLNVDSETHAAAKALNDHRAEVRAKSPTAAMGHNMKILRTMVDHGFKEFSKDSVGDKSVFKFAHPHNDHGHVEIHAFNDHRMVAEPNKVVFKNYGRGRPHSTHSNLKKALKAHGLVESQIVEEFDGEMLNEVAEAHEKLKDHTKNPFHKILTKHGFTHVATHDKKNHLAPNDPNGDYTQHIYTKPSHNPDKPHQVRIEQAHTAYYGSVSRDKNTWFHFHVQSNNIVAPGYAYSKPSLDKSLTRQYGTPVNEETHFGRLKAILNKPTK